MTHLLRASYYSHLLSGGVTLQGVARIFPEKIQATQRFPTSSQSARTPHKAIHQARLDFTKVRKNGKLGKEPTGFPKGAKDPTGFPKWICFKKQTVDVRNSFHLFPLSICIIGWNQTTLMILLGNPVFTWQSFLLPRLIISNHSSKTQLAKETLHPSHTWNIDAWCCRSLGSVRKRHDYPPWKLTTIPLKIDGSEDETSF